MNQRPFVPFVPFVVCGGRERGGERRGERAGGWLGVESSGGAVGG